MRYLWERLRRKMGLPDVRIHDLRRTASSWLSIHGSNIQVIPGMLNHKSLTSTQIYACLSVEPVRQALNDQCERMLGPVPTPPPQIPMWSPLRDERETWPG